MLTHLFNKNLENKQVKTNSPLISKYIMSLFLLFMMLFFVGCKDKEEDGKEKEEEKLIEYLEENDIEVEPTSTGLYYIQEKEGAGKNPEYGDLAVFNFVARFIDDEIFDTNNDSIAQSDDIYKSKYSEIVYSPVRTIVGNNIAGIDEGIKMMKPGGEAQFIIPSHLAYGENGLGVIPPYATLIYDIELMDVITDPQAYEDSMINLYIDKNNLSPEETASGLYYDEIYSGTGDNPTWGQYVSIKYTAKIIDGRVYDKTTADTVFSFSLYDRMMIDGISEGVAKMNVGGKANLIIPYELAYGKYGNYPIPPYATLVFENLELVEIHDE